MFLLVEVVLYVLELCYQLYRQMALCREAGGQWFVIYRLALCVRNLLKLSACEPETWLSRATENRRSRLQLSNRYPNSLARNPKSEKRNVFRQFCPVWRFRLVRGE